MAAKKLQKKRVQEDTSKDGDDEVLSLKCDLTYPQKFFEFACHGR